MSIQVSYTKSTNKPSGNVVFFVDEKFNSKSLKKFTSSIELSYINDLLKSCDLKKKILVFDLNSKRKIILISIKKNIKSIDIENLGAEFYGYVNSDKKNQYFVNSDTVISNQENFIGHFLHGLKLKSYEFKKYKSKKNNKIISIEVLGEKNKPSKHNQLKFKALEAGTFFARDLVSEPGNILHPDEYAKRLNYLKKDGLKVTIYDKKN